MIKGNPLVLVYGGRMSTLSNWTGFNKKPDVIGPRHGRSILNLIRSLQYKIEQFQIDEAMAAFAQHAQDHNNPHHLRFTDLPKQIMISIYNQYSQKSTLPITFDEWSTLIDVDPMLLFEIGRRAQLNAMLYVDGIGPTQVPVFDPSHLVHAFPKSPPLYFLSHSLPDFMFTQSGSDGVYTKTMDLLSANVFSFAFSLQTSSTDTAPDSVVTLENENGGSISFYIDEHQNLFDLSIGDTTFIVSSVPPVDNPTAQGLINYYPLEASVSEFKFALTFSGTEFIIYYIYNNVIQSVSIGVSEHLDLKVFNILKTFIPTWDAAKPNTGIKNLVVYPGVLSSEEIDGVFSTL